MASEYLRSPLEREISTTSVTSASVGTVKTVTLPGASHKRDTDDIGDHDFPDLSLLFPSPPPSPSSSTMPNKFPSPPYSRNTAAENYACAQNVDRGRSRSRSRIRHPSLGRSRSPTHSRSRSRYRSPSTFARRRRDISRSRERIFIRRRTIKEDL